MALGGIFAFFHLCWGLLVLVGLAQQLLDLVFRLHFIVPVMQISPFSIKLLLGLLVLTFAVGYILGWVFASIWNWLQK